MKFNAPVLAAVASLAAMAPTSTQAWSMGPSTSSLFFPSTLMLDSPSARMMRKMDRAMREQQQQRMYQSSVSSPRYEITNNDEKFQLAVAVPGVKMEDLSVNLEDNVLTVSGHRGERSGDDNTANSYSFTSKFSQSFSLSDPSIDLDKFSATLENGVLLVTAPKDMKKLEENIRTIPITVGEDTASTELQQQVTVESEAVNVVESKKAEEKDEVVAEEKKADDDLEITEG